MSLRCGKCDHFVSQVAHYTLDDRSLLLLCNRCEIELEDDKWELPEDRQGALEAKIYVKPERNSNQKTE